MASHLALKTKLISVRKQLRHKTDHESTLARERLQLVIDGLPCDPEENMGTACTVARALAPASRDDVVSQLRHIVRVAEPELNALVDKAIADASGMPPLVLPKRAKTIVATRPERGTFQNEASGKNIGKPKPNQHNIEAALAKLGVSTAYNEFTGSFLMRFDDPPREEIREDHHVNALLEDIEHSFDFEVSPERLRRYLDDAAHREGFHPVREYFEKLPAWDGVPRLESWLTESGAADTPLVRAVSKIILVAAVRRVYQPGAKFDELVVIETPKVAGKSGQGKSKSETLRALCPRDEWFNDDFSFAHVDDSRKMIEQTKGFLIVEPGELTGMNSKEVAAIKQYLSRPVDTARMAYGRDVERVPRQFVLIATVNEETYLRDETGNRRFWPVRISKFNIEWIRQNRDHLWAEALAAHRAGESIRLDPSLWDAAAAEQDARMQANPIADRVIETLGNITGRLKASDLWPVLGRGEQVPSPKEQGVIASALADLGWERKQKRIAGAQTWMYLKGTDAERERDVVVNHVAGKWVASLSPVTNSGFQR